MADDIFHLNQHAPDSANDSTPQGESIIPLAQNDIVIRTLASDIASLAASGGNRVVGEVISSSQHTPVSANNTPASLGGSLADTPIQHSSRSYTPLFLAMGIIGLGIIAAIGYVIWVFFWQPRMLSALPSGTEPTATSSSSSTLTSPSIAPAVGVFNFSHTSFLKKAADQIFTLAFSQSVTASEDLQTYTQKVSLALQDMRPQTSFVELHATQSNGSDVRPIGFGEFMYAISTNLIDQQSFASYFNPDFTFFIYRDANGYWPGFILQLQPSKNWLFVKEEIRRIEKATARDSIFLTQPGIPSGDGFRDDVVSDLPVRSLNYSNPSASFLYGWVRNYLIISTSRDGMREVLQRI
ncbi:MAG: hypothetical protein RIQ54_545 [Candidatus Parcubacteria bacterium]|jgi:hypothetical protein